MKFKNLLIKFKRSILAVALVFLFSGVYAQDFSEQKITQASVFPFGDHNMALDTLGRIWTWGSNTQGQIGDGTNTSPVTTPYLITMTADSTSLEGVVFTKVVAAYSNSYAIDENGQLWGWGDNAYQQLAMEGTEDQFGPVKIMEGTQIVDIYAGKNFNYAKDSEGKFWVWGRNSSSGQLGLGTTGTNVVTPVEFSIEGVTIVKLDPADAHAIALDSNGDIWVWGNRSYGRLGLDVSENQPTPVKLELTGGDGNLVKFADISTGQYHNLAVDSTGNIWAWGRNSFGQLGNGTTDTGELPVQVTSDTTFVSVHAGGNYSFAYDSEGNLYSFGWNTKPYYGYDLIGTDSTDNVLVPTMVDRYNYSNVMTGWTHRLYLDENGGLWGWGNNASGQLTGTKTPYVAPILLNGYATLSNDSTLASLTVTPGTLSPGFNSAVADYMVQVPAGTTSVDIAATVSNPGALVTGTGTIELASADTTVSVMVMAEDGSTMTYNVNVTIAVGVKDQVYNIARVYPNPTSGILNIEGQQVQTIEVYNLSGSKMRVETNGDNQIDVSSLVHGTYILRITNTKNQVSVVKFVKVTGTR